MITHVIYHITGRKVGCTRDFESRKSWYPKNTTLEILEELHDKTDQEAGDIEWSWADKFGYPRGNHYTRTGAVLQTPEERTTYALLRNQMITPEQRLKNAQQAAITIGPERRSAINKRAAAQIPTEKRIERSRLGGLKGGARLRELGIGVHRLTHEQRVEAGRKGGKRSLELISLEQRASNGKKGGMLGGTQKRGTCPHCGKESNLPNLYRWHFNNCKLQ